MVDSLKVIVIFLITITFVTVLSISFPQAPTSLQNPPFSQSTRNELKLEVSMGRLNKDAGNMMYKNYLLIFPILQCFLTLRF